MKTLLLADMDNTLTLARGKITQEMKEMIKRSMKKKRSSSQLPSTPLHFAHL
jgi:hydroxymethylpyrimidine pyrophosphatase-like HAD family hydrolase